MRKVIYKNVTLPAPAPKLFDMYLNPTMHEAITGSPVVVNEASGSKFQAFEGMLSGTMLQTVKPRLIVQSWRSVHFKPKDPDSTLIIEFSPKANQGRIDLVHLDVPDQDFDGVNQGWETKKSVG